MIGRAHLAVAAFLAVLRSGPGVAAGLPDATYAQQLSVRLHGSAARPDLYSARVAVHDENTTVRGSGWVGGVGESGLTHALGGGIEVSYGFLDDMKLLVELGGFGSAASGVFTGVGPNAVTDPLLGLQSQRMERVSRYPVFFQAVGATVLLRSFEWCRFGLTMRVGACELAGAVERATSTGPLGRSWWSRKLTAAAPGAFLGLEWEWLSLADGIGFPLGGFAMVGYRQLLFTSVRATYTDSSGTSVAGDYVNADGTRRKLDLSGPEARVGIQFAFSFAPAP